MNQFEKWPLLKQCVDQDVLAWVDLAFAASVLKQLSSEEEAHAALLATLLALSRQGHLTLDISAEPLSFALRLLGLKEEELLVPLLQQAADSFPMPNLWIERSGSYFYLQKNGNYEIAIAAAMQRLSCAAPKISLAVPSLDNRLNAEQKKGVMLGIQKAVSLLTGGPGTGKTFTAAQIVKGCLSSLSEEQKKEFRIILTAPTGKAVAQLEGSLRKGSDEPLNIRSGTLHAMLGLKQYETEHFQPLFADLILVDECSMIDAKIFSLLLQAVPEGARLILIGDKDQLPPVEAGSVFADLLEAEVCPATRLTQCLRSDRSGILELAGCIKEGDRRKVLQSLCASKEEIQWIDLNGLHDSASYLWDYCKARFPSAYNERPDPQKIGDEGKSFGLLSCMRQGTLGVDALNHHFLYQSLKRAPVGTWWVAPILITRNDPELGLYNGDLGVLIRKVFPDFLLRQFIKEDYAVFAKREGGFQEIPALALNAFEYCFCLSVHKSQGSEYDEVLLLMPPGSELFGREVFYTGITRARKKVTLVSTQEVLCDATRNSSRKISGLCAKLKGF